MITLGHGNVFSAGCVSGLPCFWGSAGYARRCHQISDWAALEHRHWGVAPEERTNEAQEGGGARHKATAEGVCRKAPPACRYKFGMTLKFIRCSMIVSPSLQVHVLRGRGFGLVSDTTCLHYQWLCHSAGVGSLTAAWGLRDWFVRLLCRVSSRLMLDFWALPLGVSLQAKQSAQAASERQCAEISHKAQLEKDSQWTAARLEVSILGPRYALIECVFFSSVLPPIAPWFSIIHVVALLATGMLSAWENHECRPVIARKMVLAKLWKMWSTYSCSLFISVKKNSFCSLLSKA